MLTALRLLGFVAALGTGLFVLVSVGVGLAYHRVLWLEYSGFAVASLGLLALSLFLLMRNARGRLVFRGLAYAIGLFLLVGGSWLGLRDPGDAVLYAGPAVLGATLIAVETMRKEERHDLS